jgi:hypothetical protein
MPNFVGSLRARQTGRVKELSTPPRHGHDAHVREQSVQNLDREIVDPVARITIRTWAAKRLPAHEHKEKESSVGDDAEQNKKSNVLKDFMIQETKQCVSTVFSMTFWRVQKNSLFFFIAILVVVLVILAILQCVFVTIRLGRGVRIVENCLFLVWPDFFVFGLHYECL